MKNVLMVVYSKFPGDTRVRREADALVDSGYNVDVICFDNTNQPSKEVFEKVRVFRLKLHKKRGSLKNYLSQYFFFFFKAFFQLNILAFKRKYDFIHVHNMPNFLVFVALLQKFFKTKIILDLHDPSPEIFLSSVNKSAESLLFKLLVIEEKLSIKFADKIITTNKAFKDLFISRGCPEDKISIVMNSPQTNLFNKHIAFPEEHSDNTKFRIMYNGSIIHRLGLDTLIEAMGLLKNKIPEIELTIFGGGEFLPDVLKKIESLSLVDNVIYKGACLLDIIVEEIPKMDLGVIPNRFNMFTNLNFPVRIFEFVHFKKPVIVPNTKGIRDYFGESSILYFEPENIHDLAEKIFSVYSKEDSIKRVVDKSYQVYLNHTWEKEQQTLLEVYKSFEKK